MSDFNRTERKALLVAAGLIGLAALGRVVIRPDRADVAWVSSSPASPPVTSQISPGTAPAETKPLSSSAEQLKEDVEVALRREERALTPLAGAERVDPNQAPEEELRRLPGIGPARARAILEERARGSFESPQALMRVPGIGPVTYARIAPFLTVGGRTPQTEVRGVVAPMDGCGALDRVDPNTATETELRALPGIGPALARRIVRNREASGPFGNAEALLRVSGIGPRLLEGVRDRVCLSGR